MKIKSLFINSLLSASLSFAPFAMAGSADDDTPKKVTLNPQTMRELVEKRNLAIKLELDNLYAAKTNVSLASANLLPSLSVGFGVSNPISFALKAASFLLPFLLPSNWLNLREAQIQLQAEGLGFYALKLNTFASTEGLYYTLIGDLEAQKLLHDQAKVMDDIYKLVKARNDFGFAKPGDVADAESNKATAHAQAMQADLVVNNELAAVRKFLRLNPETEIMVEENHESPSDQEGKTAQQLADEVIEKSPEYRQMTFLAVAAAAKMRSVEYSFFNVATLGASSGSNGASTSFSDLKVGIGLNLSFGLIPQIKLSEIAIDQIKDQQKLLVQDQKYNIEMTMNGLNTALAQYDDYASAEKNARAAYNELLSQYRAGLLALLPVYIATTKVTAAAASRIQSMVNVDNQRVSLKRILRSDEFQNIKPCELHRFGEVKGGLFKHAKSVFSSSKISIEQACGAIQAAELPPEKNLN